MIEIVNTEPITQSESSLKVYNNDREEIRGPFEITATVRFDEISKKQQKVFDFAGAGGGNRILMGQYGVTNSMKFVIVQGGTTRIIAQETIVQGEVAAWSMSIKSSGAMELKKNGVVVATGQGPVPLDVERKLRFVGYSNSANDDRLVGLVRNLKVTNL